MKNTVTSESARMMAMLQREDALESADQFAGAFLKVLKNEAPYSEMTLLLYDDWFQTFLPSYSTDDRVHPYCVSPYALAPNVEQPKSEKKIFHLYACFVTFVLKQKQKPYGLLVCGYPKGRRMTESRFALRRLVETGAPLLFTALKYKKLEAELRRGDLAAKVTEQLHTSMKPDDVLQAMMTTLKRIYPFFTARLYLTGDGEGLKVASVEHLDIMKNGKSALAKDAFLSGRVEISSLSPDGSGRRLYVPLKGRQGTYGVLEMSASSIRAFPRRDIRFLRLLAAACGYALENARLFEQSQKFISDLRLINETTQALNANLNTGQAARFMMRKLRASSGAQEVGFSFLNGMEIEVLSESTSYFMTEAGRCFLQQLIKQMEKEQEALFLTDAKARNFPDFPFRSLIAVPMTGEKASFGVGVLCHRQPSFFTFETFKLACALIQNAALAFKNARLHEALHHAVITDPLTKLKTRAYLDEQMKRSLKSDSCGSFILFDIDDFKKINDRYGHQTGDRVLICVADLMMRNVRSTDIAARWGGEELAVYLPKTDRETAFTVADRLATAIARESSPNVTVSCGVASWEKTTEDIDSDTLFRRADAALYRAKHGGKNRVVLHA